jgi:TonB family protein
MHRSHMTLDSTNILLRSVGFLLVASSIVLLPSECVQDVRARTLSSSSSAAQQSTDWQRYTVKEEDLSVLLPTVPAVNTYRFTSWGEFSLSRQHLRTLIGAYSQGVVYVIEIFEVRQSLDEFLAESRRGSSADIRREVTVSGIRGTEYTLENDKVRAVTQVFVRGSRIYVFRAQGSRLGNPDVGIPRFFESIKFERSSVGVVMVDGPGIQESTDPTPVTDSKGVVVLSGKEVTTKAIVITKPEPRYTEEARQKAVTGTVVLRGVFSSYGKITNLRVISGLPHGLTENAIAAARQIRFIPAIKDGQFVSMYIQLEYNFDLY